DGELRSSPNAFRVALPSFEGPLDLLLHLIREHKLDIFDIPIALITQKYVEHLDKMREVNLDIAGEFLVMASTLAHIKSRLLLPRQEAQGEIDQPEQGDPRADLVRRLLEYQKYKHAAQQLASHDLLDRNVFVRRVAIEPVPRAEDDLGLVEVSIFKLIEALDRVLKNAAPEIQHEVVLDRVTISESIQRIADRLRAAGGPVSFFALFDGQKTRQRIVVTFLGLLEMCKLRLIRVRQEGDEIVVEARGSALADAASTEVQDEYQ
ncbi:MAG TPA: segregation/condensation protein A, partial [Myxococcaceae bacterium]|nr:segregation/condensation protein A [Myxococcaceae bacterium]